MPATTTVLKFLIESGLGSRRKLTEAIKQGQVRVNGVPVESFKYEIDPSADSVTIGGRPASSATCAKVYLIMNKPAGVLTTTSDEQGRRTVLDLLPEKYRSLRVYPVGRLDKNSTGLLILTNDGDLTYQLSHPRFEHEKEYLVEIEGTLTPEEHKRLEHGVQLEDGLTYPARVRPTHKRAPYNYSIVIHEGRKRQVRRMFEELGHTVRALHRTRVGRLRLDNLREGETRAVTREDIL